MKTPKSARFLTTFFVLLAFIIYFIINHAQFKQILNVNILLLVVIAAADIATIFINGLFTRFILQPFKKHISLFESFKVSLISSVGNFFAPVGAGFGFRAVYLKKRYGLPYNEYVSTLSGNYIIVFLVNSFFGLISLYLLRDQYNSQYKLLLLIFVTLFLVSAMLTTVKIPVRETTKHTNRFIRGVVKNLYMVTEGWNHIVVHRRLILKLVTLTCLNLFLTMGITFTIVRSLGLTIGVAPLILFSVLGSLSLFVNITPANLGVKEAIYLFSSGVLGFSAAQILLIALVDRGVMFFVLAGSWLASRRLKVPS